MKIKKLFKLQKLREISTTKMEGDYTKDGIFFQTVRKKDKIYFFIELLFYDASHVEICS